MNYFFHFRSGVRSQRLMDLALRLFNFLKALVLSLLYNGFEMPCMIDSSMILNEALRMSDPA